MTLECSISVNLEVKNLIKASKSIYFDQRNEWRALECTARECARQNGIIRAKLVFFRVSKRFYHAMSPKVVIWRAHSRAVPSSARH